MALQKQNVRPVVIVTESFKVLAKTKAKSLGMPDIPMVVFPGHIGGLSPDEVRKKVTAGIEDLIIALINPRKSEEAGNPSDKIKVQEAVENIRKKIEIASL